LVNRGTVGCLKTVSKIHNLKDKLCSLNEAHSHTSHVVLERFKRGDIFGIYSALKHQKNNYTAVALSEKVSLYKIAKAHILLYFKGSSGTIPETLRGIDTVQQNSLKEKLDFLGRASEENAHILNKFEYKCYKEGDLTDPKIVVDETQINNYLKDAWKELENVGTKVQDFKNTLFNKPVKNDTAAASNILNKIKEQRCRA